VKLFSYSDNYYSDSRIVTLEVLMETSGYNPMYRIKRETNVQLNKIRSKTSKMKNMSSGKTSLSTTHFINVVHIPSS
jgi:hypothetical protein